MEYLTRKKISRVQSANVPHHCHHLKPWFSQSSAASPHALIDCNLDIWVSYNVNLQVTSELHCLLPPWCQRGEKDRVEVGGGMNHFSGCQRSGCFLQRGTECQDFCHDVFYLFSILADLNSINICMYFCITVGNSYNFDLILKYLFEFFKTIYMVLWSENP